MATSITSGVSPQSILIAEGCQLGTGGLLNNGAINCASTVAGANVSAVGTPSVAAPNLSLIETPLPATGAAQTFRFSVPITGVPEGRLVLDAIDGAAVPAAPTVLLRTNRAPRAGPVILDFKSASQAGTANVAAGALTQVVPCLGLTAAGIVLLTSTNAIAAQTYPPFVTAGVDAFTITVQAVPGGAGANFNWFVASSGAPSA